MTLGLVRLHSSSYCAAARQIDKSYVTRTDWTALAAILLAIPIWLLTHDPLYAALWATAIDVTAYIPTFRRSPVAGQAGFHWPGGCLAPANPIGCARPNTLKQGTA